MTLIGDCYRVIHSNFSRKPSRFGWIIEDKLAASGRIMNRSQLAWATQHGIKSVITILEHPLQEKWFPSGCGIDYRHLEVEDYGAPTLAQIAETVDYIDNQLENDRPVIVHCNGGSGRTGTILAAFLMKKENLNVQQAFKRVKELRGRHPRHKKQLSVLSDYQNYLTSSQSRKK